ncbi:MAG: secretin N-terminal domain-containing protein [Candidatus Theseobacter exili]|nr:secretin N-terminal domain-containing protein [Candidatus Theseobacter exili]
MNYQIVENNNNILKIILCYCMFIIVFALNLYAEDNTVSLNFKDADIKLVIEFVGEITQKNFVVDEEVAGKVTIISPVKIPADQVYDVLLSVLRVHGYEAIDNGRIVNIIPAKKAAKISALSFSSGAVESEGQYVSTIYPLKQAEAQKVADILRPVLSEGGAVSVYKPNNTIIITDMTEIVNKLSKIIDVLDSQTPVNREDLYVVSLKHADAETLAGVLKGLYVKGTQGTARANIGNAHPVIVADKDSNALVIAASSRNYKQLSSIIKDLDEERLQVLVEVLIAEVSMNELSEFGIELAAIDGIIYGSPTGFGGTRITRAKDLTDNILTGGGGGLDGSAAAFAKGEKTIGKVSFPEYGILVTAFQNTQGVDILSAPQILTLDNKEAHILVGENLAFIKNSQVTAEGGTVRTFEYKDVGLSLSITPHVSEENLIRLKVNQKVENVLGFSFEGAVETSKREVLTEVVVEDGGTVVLGGLIRNEIKDEIEKVPFLGDIPILGHLFKRTKKMEVKSNLLIFICPHVVRSQNDLQELTKERQLQIEEAKSLQKKQKKAPARRRRSGRN